NVRLTSKHDVKIFQNVLKEALKVETMQKKCTEVTTDELLESQMVASDPQRGKQKNGKKVVSAKDTRDITVSRWWQWVAGLKCSFRKKQIEKHQPDMAQETEGYKSIQYSLDAQTVDALEFSAPSAPVLLYSTSPVLLTTTLDLSIFQAQRASKEMPANLSVAIDSILQILPCCDNLILRPNSIESAQSIL
ncbi:hypothetical protein HDV00_006699, partial [Rhizophlyctis rosea]